MAQFLGILVQVWLGRTVNTSKEVAIKVPNNLHHHERLNDEGCILSRMDHLNIVKPLGYIKVPQMPDTPEPVLKDALVFEHCAAGTLADLVFHKEAMNGRRRESKGLSGEQTCVPLTAQTRMCFILSM